MEEFVDGDWKWNWENGEEGEEGEGEGGDLISTVMVLDRLVKFAMVRAN